MTLKKQYDEYVARRKASGGAFVTYACPACNNGIETPEPPQGEQWDSAASCPHCLALHMMVARHGQAVGRMAQPQQPASDEKSYA